MIENSPKKQTKIQLTQQPSAEKSSKAQCYAYMIDHRINQILENALNAVLWQKGSGCVSNLSVGDNVIAKIGCRRPSI